MNLRLWQRLFLAFAALSSIALAGFAFWQQQAFRRGFLGYLDEVALERLQPVAERLAVAYAEQGGWETLRANKFQFGELVEPGLSRMLRGGRGRDHADARHPEHPRPDSHGALGPMRERRADAADMGRDPLDMRPLGPRPPSDLRGHALATRARLAAAALLPRLLLVDAAGSAVVGDPAIVRNSAAVPIELDGVRIGTLHLASQPQLRGDADLAFAREQLRNALIAGIAVLAFSLLLAFALARWLLDPVRALAAGTRALAAGDYARRVEDQRGDELGALAQDFNHLARTLEQHRDARRRWGADIAHELRTPLSILRGEIHALQDGVRNVTPAALTSLNAECERMGGLIEDLYQLSLADAGALEYRYEAVDLAALLHETLGTQVRALADAGLDVEQTIAQVPAIRGDPRRLGQLIDNLLANTRRYTDAPGRIRIQLSARQDSVLLQIEDSAPGVPQDSLALLFDRLYRVDRSRNRAAGGAGLGLAICRAIALAHDADIEATASALGGLRISVRFPALAPTP